MPEPEVNSDSSSRAIEEEGGELSLEGADWAALRKQFERDGYLVFEGACFSVSVVLVPPWHTHNTPCPQPGPSH